MNFHPTPLPGVFLIDLDQKEDERGFFARIWCPREFANHGLETKLAQCSISYTRLAGTLRGMHYQVAPSEEAKLVRCIKGAIYDVAIDLRPESPKFKSWTSVELTAENRRAIYIPRGCAHGFQTLVDETEVLYQISEFHDGPSARGVRYDDPAFAIRWPRPVSCISERDRTYADFDHKTSS